MKRKYKLNDSHKRKDLSFAGRGVHLLFRINSVILVCCLASMRLVYLQYPLICHGLEKIK
jgi:hypothetical protein